MNLISAFLFLLGSFFLLLAAAGSMKFPDLFMRMAAVSKASTLGVILCALAAAFHFHEGLAWAKMLVLVAFFLLSAPIAAHLLGRAAFRKGIPLFHRTYKDKDSNQI